MSRTQVRKSFEAVQWRFRGLSLDIIPKAFEINALRGPAYMVIISTMTTILSIFRPISLLVSTSGSALKSQSALALENLALRQQLAVFKEKSSRPQLRQMDRIFWIWLKKIWAGWKTPLHIVQPDTVIGWEQQRWRLYWRKKSSGRKRGRPIIALNIRKRIRRMA